MLNLTNKDIEHIGQDRYIAKNKPLLIIGTIAFVLAAMLFMNTSNNYKTVEYKMVNGDTSIMVQYEYNQITIDDIAYKKTVDDTTGGFIALSGCILATVGLAIYSIILINANKRGKQLLWDYKKSSDKPCETP